MGGEEGRLSPDSVGKHQGPKRKWLSWAPGAINQLLVTQRWQGQGPRAKGWTEAVTPNSNHPHTYTLTHSQTLGIG